MKFDFGVIVRAYKSVITYKANKTRKTRGAPIWRRNYYEHIIRNQRELENIRKYIQLDPMKWAQDEENPKWLNHH